MENCNLPTDREPASARYSRRSALSGLFAVSHSLPALLAADNAPVRLAISESLVADVNLNDARASMQIWLRKMSEDLNLVIEISPKIFDSTREIQTRARNGQLDAVALNVVEYRQIADVLDPSQVIIEATTSGLEQYILLVKRNGAARQLGDLRGSRLSVLKAPKMCIASAWLNTLLDEGHLGLSEEFFGSVTTDTKYARVVLPVFFGQVDACLTSKRGFDTMCELNPQVAKDLTVIASSPPMVVTFYVFHKNYRSANRERFLKIYTTLPTNAAGRQLATLFQFENLVVKDASCLATALALLERSDRARRPATGGRKGPQ